MECFPASPFFRSFHWRSRRRPLSTASHPMIWRPASHQWLPLMLELRRLWVSLRQRMQLKLFFPWMWCAVRLGTTPSSALQMQRFLPPVRVRAAPSTRRCVSLVRPLQADAAPVCAAPAMLGSGAPCSNPRPGVRAASYVRSSAPPVPLASRNTGAAARTYSEVVASVFPPAARVLPTLVAQSSAASQRNSARRRNCSAGSTRWPSSALICRISSARGYRTRSSTARTCTSTAWPGQARARCSPG